MRSPASADVSQLAARAPERSPRRRGVLIMLFGYAALAMVAALLPLPVPTMLPALRQPAWFAIAAVAAGLGLVLIADSAARRPLLLGAGWLLVALTVTQAFVVGDLPALLGLWLAVPTLALLAGQVRRPARKALVATHAIAAAAWIGITVTILAMSVVALTTRSSSAMVVTYQLMVGFDLTLLPWANFATTLSGIALGLVTPWGLLRYYWVAIKLMISLTILALAFGLQHNLLVTAAMDAERIESAGDLAPDLGALPAVILAGFAFALINLAAAMLLSLYKPGGKTKRGQRRLPRRWS